MIRRTALASLCAAAFLLAAPLPAVAADPAAKARVVLQVSDPDPAKWNLALNNAKNLQNDLGVANTEIEIVAYGPGIGMLKADATTANRVIDAMATGVKVVACENTMKAQKLSRDDMHGKVGYVMAGVVELMRRQQQGWAYLRP